MTSRKRESATARPWDHHDPEDKATIPFTWRMNAYDQALLRYVTGLLGERSAQKTITKLLREGALRIIADQEGRRGA